MIFYKVDQWVVGRFVIQNIANMKPYLAPAGLLLAMLLTGWAQPAAPSNPAIKHKEGNMTTIQHNKSIIRRMYDEALNKHQLSVLKLFVSGDYIGAGGIKGPEGFAAALQPLIDAFADLEWHVEELIGEGNKIVVRWTLKGTHTAAFNEVAPTGKKISNSGVGYFELRNGLVVGGAAYTDRLGFLQDLGVLPVPVVATGRQLRSGDRTEAYAGDSAAAKGANAANGPDALLSPVATPTGAVRFIDRFVVPAVARNEFLARVKINRDFIRQLPGFAGDEAVERIDEKGNTELITIALWRDAEALGHAKEAVQAYYLQEGFEPAAMMKRLGITMERGVYMPVK